VRTKDLKNPYYKIHYPSLTPRVSGGHTNQEFNQAATAEFQQNSTKEQVLPPVDSMHNAATASFYFPGVNY